MRLFCNHILRKNVLRALGYLKLCLELIIQIKFFAKSIFANSPYRRQFVSWRKQIFSDCRRSASEIFSTNYICIYLALEILEIA